MPRIARSSDGRRGASFRRLSPTVGRHHSAQSGTAPDRAKARESHRTVSITDPLLEEPQSSGGVARHRQGDGHGDGHQDALGGEVLDPEAGAQEFAPARLGAALPSDSGP
jgi:hypothetical protein